MILPVPAWPLKEQSGFGQQQDRLLLGFIHVLMTENNQEIQVGSCVARLLETVGESQQHFPEEAPIFLNCRK